MSSSEDKICCFITWNIFIRGIIFLLLIGIIFDIYKFDKITLVQLGSAIGAIIGLYLLHERNKQLEKQSKIQYEIFRGTREFDNFLEATKLLTNKDSTVEAKTSALYLLYDLSLTHKHNIERIVQIINKHINNFLKCLDLNSDCNIYIDENSDKKELNKSIINKEIIKNWKYIGNDDEKIISVSLEILSKIFANNIKDRNTDKNFSHSVIFDYDVRYSDNDNIIKTSKPVENLFFLYCNLEKFNFRVNYFHCYFYYDNLANTNFENSNLWGSYFYKCNLKETSFDNCECEGVIFDNCNLSLEQIKRMKFKNKERLKKHQREFVDKIKEINVNIDSIDNFYPIVIKDNKEEIQNISCFTEIEQYEKFMELKNEFIN